MTPNFHNPRRPSKQTQIILLTSLTLAGLFTVSPTTPLVAAAQATAPAPSVNRFVGTITSAINGVLTVKTDTGVERKVTVPDGIKLQRIAPGEKDLSKAATIQFSELAVGDRVLVRLAPDPATDPVTAISIVAIPQADLAQKQQKDREEWQRNGVGGLVKSTDPGTGVILITSGAGAAQKTITLHTTPTTVLRRYAPDSVNFDQAKPAPLEVIKPGDQLRARGTKNADGTEVAAEEVVSGSFRNISGTISSIDQAAMTVTLKDLVTKQTVSVHIGPDAQMRKLPEQMAKMLANATSSSASGQGTANSSAGGRTGSPDGHTADGKPTSSATASAKPADSSTAPSPNAPGGSGGMHGQDGGESASHSGRHGGGDPQQMLARAPAIHLSDLQKGDAVMLVSTQGTNDVTAITLLAGVEPLLQAPASTQNMLLSNWNMSSGGAEAAQ